MKSSNTVSVVIPLYNKSKHILRTLDSVVNQVRAIDEVIVVNDGSTDDGAQKVAYYIVRNDLTDKVKLINQTNAGVSAARNRGIQEASSDLIAFLDADDTWSVHYLEEIDHMVNLYPLAGAYTTGYQKVIGEQNYIDPKVRGVDQQDRQMITNFFAICSQGDLPFMTSSVCIRAQVLKELGGFPEGEAMGEDQDVWARLALFSSIAYSPRVLSYYHLDAENRACINNIPDRECPFSERLNDYVSKETLSKEMSESILRYTATHLINLVRLQTQVGNIQAAAKLLSEPRCQLLKVKAWVCQVKLWLKIAQIKGLKLVSVA